MKLHETEDGTFLILHLNLEGGDVRWLGEKVEPISTKEVRCEERTEYNGCLLDRWTKYTIPGTGAVITKHEWNRGPDLMRSGVDWSIDPADNTV